MAVKVALGNKWDKEFEKALELDTWGQFEEARQAYDTLARNMIAEYTGGSSRAGWTPKEAKAVERLAISLRLRSLVIKRDDGKGIDLENMKALTSVFNNLFKKDKKFPLDLDGVPPEDLKKASFLQEEDDSDEEEVEVVLEEGGTRVPTLQQPAPASSAAVRNRPSTPDSTPPEPASKPAANVSTPKKGKKNVLVTIQKIGLKDYHIYQDPFVTVYIVSGGKVIDGTQDCAVSQEKDDLHILFGDTIKLKQSYEAILPGAAVFFEFKHFKRDKQKISTKCWAFLEREDLKEGPHVLELYKKPADLKRKKLNLHTVKPLYLHINIEFKVD